MDDDACNKLARLDLSRCGLDGRAVASVIHYLQNGVDGKRECLKIFKISMKDDPFFDPASSSNLCQALKVSTPNLMSLGFYKVMFDEEGIGLLAEALRSSVLKLEDLRFCACSLGTVKDEPPTPAAVVRRGAMAEVLEALAQSKAERVAGGGPKGLTKFEFSECKTDSEGVVEVIAEHIKHGALVRVQHLDLHGINLTDKLLGSIIKAFGNHQVQYLPLKSFLISNNALEAAGVGELMQGMSRQVGTGGYTRLSEVVALDLSNNGQVSKQGYRAEDCSHEW